MCVYDYNMCIENTLTMSRLYWICDKIDKGRGGDGDGEAEREGEAEAEAEGYVIHVYNTI